MFLVHTSLFTTTALASFVPYCMTGFGGNLDCMIVAIVHVSLLMAKIVSVDRRFVMGSKLGVMCINLYSLSVSIEIDLMWLCFVSMRCINVGLVGVSMMR